MSTPTKHDDLPPEAFGVELDPLPPWAREEDAAARADRVIHTYETEARGEMRCADCNAVFDHGGGRCEQHDAPTVRAPALPPDAAALVAEAETLGPDRTEFSVEEVLLWVDRTIPALCALVREQQGEIAKAKAETEDARAAHDAAVRGLRDAHARERAGLEGDKAQLAVDLDAARERAHGLANKTAIAIQQRANVEAERDRMKPVVEAAECWADEGRGVHGSVSVLLEAVKAYRAQKGSPS